MILLPNPASTSVQLQITAGSITAVQVMDNLGRTVIGTHSLSGSVLDISSLATGTYMVKVNTDRGVATQRLSVIR